MMDLILRNGAGHQDHTNGHRGQALGKGKFSTYGKFPGCSNYLVMAGQKSDDLDPKVDYYGEQLVLLAQTLGLNTCCTGMTYSKIKSASDVRNACGLTPEWFRAGVDMNA